MSTFGTLSSGNACEARPCAGASSRTFQHMAAMAAGTALLAGAIFAPAAWQGHAASNAEDRPAAAYEAGRLADGSDAPPAPPTAPARPTPARKAARTRVSATKRGPAAEAVPAPRGTSVATHLLASALMAEDAAAFRPALPFPANAALASRFVPRAEEQHRLEPHIALAEAEPAAAAVPPPLPMPAAAIPASAEEALEAALVPMPSARPVFERPVRLSRPERAVPPAGALAYARPDAGSEEPAGRADLFSARRPAPSADPQPGNGVAVYDISAATVFMPNGERLEAHSGLGAMRDNPRYVKEKNRGPTPPHSYDLTLRESLFHGVEAIRLHPVGGERRIYNRVGLLAHTYMLGRGGDSNGCVSFKDYKRFLAAYRRGEVRRLVVVTTRNASPMSRLSSLFSRR